MDTYIANFVGKVLLFKLTDEFSLSTRGLFQTPPTNRLIYAKLLAVDGIGGWIENSKWKTIDAETKEICHHLPTY